METLTVKATQTFDTGLTCIFSMYILSFFFFFFFFFVIHIGVVKCICGGHNCTTNGASKTRLNDDFQVPQSVSKDWRMTIDVCYKTYRSPTRFSCSLASNRQGTLCFVLLECL